jgi:hypothetical protein
MPLQRTPIAPIIFDREQNENRTFSYLDDLYAFKDAHDGKVPVDFSSFVLFPTEICNKKYRKSKFKK